jgi:hypothetical protein
MEQRGRWPRKSLGNTVLEAPPFPQFALLHSVTRVQTQADNNSRKLRLVAVASFLGEPSPLYAAGFDALEKRWEGVSVLVEDMPRNKCFFQIKISHV